ncbi:MAG: AAA family ATPase [Mobilicoccus sp.]|nr:AAA family ATPase [Mobilicoccus sp.]
MHAVKADLQSVSSLAGDLTAAMKQVIEGKDDVVDVAVTTLLAGGHLLLEDVPGVGKTTLAKTLARAIGAPMRRIQFTPDLMPSDVTGVSIFDPETREFRFRPGAIFATVVVCDEINRATPKAQSAVLECMEEAQVTVDGQTYGLDAPFFVVATQNPLEMEGTYPLPEAQRDRFMARLSMGYPSTEAEMALLDHHGAGSTLGDLTPVTNPAAVAAAIEAVGEVYASESLRRYIVDIVRATRSHGDLRLGASPRAGLHLLRAARSRAAMRGREHVLPDDVQALAVPVLEHRLLLSSAGRLSHSSTGEALMSLLGRVTP